MDLQQSLDSLEQVPGCLSACLLTADGELLVGTESAVRQNFVRAMLNGFLALNTALSVTGSADVFSGMTIADRRKKIIVRRTGQLSERVLLAVETDVTANEQKIKFKIYSLFEEE